MAQTDILLPTQSAGALPVVRTLHVADLKDALRKGLADFWAMPTHIVFLCAIYPLVGLLLLRASFAYDVFPILYPLATGFALIGPIAAIGLYELSRRAELGLDTSWSHVFDVLHSPSLGPIAALASLLLVIFGVWIATAHALYVSAFGYVPLTSWRCPGRRPETPTGSACAVEVETPWRCGRIRSRCSRVRVTLSRCSRPSRD